MEKKKKVTTTTGVKKITSLINDRQLFWEEEVDGEVVKAINKYIVYR